MLLYVQYMIHAMQHVHMLMLMYSSLVARTAQIMAPKIKIPYCCRCPRGCGAPGHNARGCSCNGGKSHKCLGKEEKEEKEWKEEKEEEVKEHVHWKVLADSNLN